MPQKDSFYVCEGIKITLAYARLIDVRLNVSFKVTLYHGANIVPTNDGATQATFSTTPVNKREAMQIKAG